MIIVLAHGCFEVFHPGHLRHLQAARSLGDRLVVSVTPDQHVNKGNGRPVFSQADRAAIIRELGFVYGVLEFDDSTAISAINACRPDIYAKGPDYVNGDTTGNLDKERTAVEEYGGRLVIIRNQVVYSSTSIISGKLLTKRINDG